MEKTEYLVFRFYRRNKQPLTKSVPAIITTPIRKLDWMLDSRDIRIDKKLGSGQFGNVHSGKMRLQDEKTWIHVAVKRCTKTEAMSDEEKQEFLREAKLMLNYQHENVVKIYGVAANRPPIMIIMELCPGGSLDSYLVRQKGKVSAEEKMKFCIEAVEGMEYLASKKCVHRDLAARNCLLGASREVKIADFGMSRQGKYQIVSKDGKKVPLRWTAPESLREGKFTTESDIYSYGILCWEIFADGSQSWPEFDKKKQVFQAVISGKKQGPPKCTPQIMCKLMFSTWALNPAERPSFTQIKNVVERTRRI